MRHRPRLCRSRENFLAKFFRTHECGLVVSEASDEALLKAWTSLREDQDLALRLASNGYHAASYFEGSKIAALCAASLARSATSFNK